MIMKLASLLFIIIAFTAFTLSKDISNSTNNATLSATTPSFTATIFDHNNNDITQSFQILFYAQALQQHARPLSNSTSTPHRRRRVVSRPLNGCSNQSRFVSSHCNAITNARGSLQAYTIVCRHGRNGGPPTTRGHSIITRTQGRCEPSEICVDSVSEVEPSNPRYQEGDHIGLISVPTATCVTDDAFEPSDTNSQYEIARYWGAAVGLMGDTPLLVRAALSRVDKVTPLQVDQLVMEAGSPSSDKGEQEQVVCRDCVGLRKKVEGGLDGLKVEARLMTGLQVGVTGVLWLTAMTG